jgi:RNA polymerase sigma-70 factor, ECF subfamily
VNNGAAWKEFVSRFQRDISLSIIRSLGDLGERPQKAAEDDLVQDTYLKPCADGCQVLLGFAIRHPEKIPAYIL